MAHIEDGGGGAFLGEVYKKALTVRQNYKGDTIGGGVLVTLQDEGTESGTIRLGYPKSTLDGRLITETPTLLVKDLFNYGAQSTARSILNGATMTANIAGGFLNLNSSAITTLSTGVIYQDRVPIMVCQEGVLRYEAILQLSAIGATNTELYFGRGIPAATANLKPLDGVYIKITNNGVYLIVNNNGSETVAEPSQQFIPELNTGFKVKIMEYIDAAELWIDDVFYVSIASPARGGVTASATGFLFFQHMITAVAASVATVFRVSAYTAYVTTSGGLSGVALKAIQNCSTRNLIGSNVNGSIAKIVNNSNATAAVPTNTTAALGSGLGGEFWETDTLAVTTDGIISSYQVPANTVAISGKTLMLRGVWIDSVVQTGLTGGRYYAVWNLAVGHTAVALTTADAATTKSASRVELGTQIVASDATALTKLDRIYVQFSAEIPVYPGEFVQTVKKKVGTAPTGGVIAHYIAFDWYWAD